MTTFGIAYRGESEPAYPADVLVHEPYAPSVVQRGMAAFCTCGWHPSRHPGSILAHHLEEMAVAGCRVPGWNRPTTKEV